MGAHSWSLGLGVPLLAPWSPPPPREQYGVPLVNSLPTSCSLLSFEIGLVCGSQGKAASLSTVRHTLRTELKLYAPRRCWQEALTAPMEELALFNRRSGVLQGSLGDARQRTPCYLACRHATAAYVNVSGEGDEKSFE